MPEPDLIELFVGPLEQLQVRYLISGSVAAMLYGEPRVTHDKWIQRRELNVEWNQVTG